MSDKEIFSALNDVAAEELGRLKYMFGEAYGYAIVIQDGADNLILGTPEFNVVKLKEHLDKSAAKGLLHGKHLDVMIAEAEHKVN